MDKAKDYFGLLGDLWSTSLIIFKISRVHSHFRNYIHADDVMSWTTIHVRLRATSFPRVLGSNQQPLSCVCITTINEKLWTIVESSSAQSAGGCMCDHTVAQTQMKHQGQTSVMMDGLLICSFIKLCVASWAVPSPKESLHYQPAPTICTIIQPRIFLQRQLTKLILMRPLPFSTCFHGIMLFSSDRIELSEPPILCCNPRHGLDIPLTPDLSKNLCCSDGQCCFFQRKKKKTGDIV